jgi:NTP pyrophosphatase (non-canonical NTP hydrolase)
MNETEARRNEKISTALIKQAADIGLGLRQDEFSDDSYRVYRLSGERLDPARNLSEVVIHKDGVCLFLEGYEMAIGYMVLSAPVDKCAVQTQLNNLVIHCHATAREKGFYDGERAVATDARVAQLLMLIVSELGEACEASRKELHGYEVKDTFEDEIADVFIRLFDLCGFLGLDIGKQVLWKMRYNENRERLHGKKF